MTYLNFNVIFFGIICYSLYIICYYNLSYWFPKCEMLKLFADPFFHLFQQFIQWKFFLWCWITVTKEKKHHRVSTYIYKRSCGIRGKIDHNVLYHTIGLSQFLRSFNFDDTWEVCFLKEVRFLLFHLLSHGSFRRKGITGHSKALNNLWW